MLRECFKVEINTAVIEPRIVVYELWKPLQLFAPIDHYSNPIVESKSNRDFSYKVQVKVGLRELKIELEKKRAGRF